MTMLRSLHLKMTDNKFLWHFSVRKDKKIDLFSLYVLISHFRPRDATRGNSFFEISSYARANVRMTIEKNKKEIPVRALIKWFEMGKQNVQAEKVY